MAANHWAFTLSKLTSLPSQWSEDDTTRALAAQLQGPAITVLAQLQGAVLTYQVLVMALWDCFGERHLQQVRCGELRSCRQKPGETLQALAMIVECLARKASVGVTAETLKSSWHYCLFRRCCRYQVSKVSSNWSADDRLGRFGESVVDFNRSKSDRRRPSSWSSIITANYRCRHV